MKVFLLCYGDYIEDGIIGIFSSKDKAIKAGLKRWQEYESEPLTMEQIESRIAEFELDKVEF